MQHYTVEVTGPSALQNLFNPLNMNYWNKIMSLSVSVVNMADELWKVGIMEELLSKHEIRVNINTDTLLWKYLCDLQGLRWAAWWQVGGEERRADIDI